MTVALGTLAGVLIGSVLGFFGTWLSLRYQYRMKSIELSAQSQLKAKELMFNEYQRRIESINRKAKEISDAISNLLIAGRQAKTDEEKQQFSAAFLTVFSECTAVQKEWFRELQEELREVGLEQKAATDVRIIREALPANPTHITSEKDANHLVLDWVKSIVMMDNLRQDILKRRCENLFRSEIEFSISQTKR